MYIEVVVSTSIIMILSAILAILLTIDYARKRTKSLAMWSSGMWAFTASVALEIVFSAGIYGSLLIKSYMFLVAFLVELLAMGSMFLLKNRKAETAYILYSVIVTVFLGVELAVSNLGNIVVNGVVYGVLPMGVIIGSSLLTFPAAVLLVVISIVSYMKTRGPKLLSIIAGVIVVSVAGTLYIAAFPAFLYFAEFIGILLLWLGFVDFSALFSRKPMGEGAANRNL